MSDRDRKQQHQKWEIKRQKKKKELERIELAEIARRQNAAIDVGFMLSSTSGRVRYDDTSDDET